MSSPSKVCGKHSAYYDAYYKQVDPKNVGCIEAMVAAKFLKKSGLSDVVLSRIWDLSDPNGRGFLDKDGFFTAIKLVAIAQAGHDIRIQNIGMELEKPPKIGDLPKIMPPKIQTVQPATNIDWSISVEDRNKYEQLFLSLQPVGGYLAGNKVKSVLMDSKLPFDVLSRIWDLADQDRDGNLNKNEFIIAMHLVYQALNKKTVPAILPPELQKEFHVAEIKSVPEATLVDAFVAEFPEDIPTHHAPPPIPPMVAPVPLTSLSTSSPSLSSASLSLDWIVPHSDKVRFDTMFITSDQDRDGLVSGIEIKDVFLQSGIPNICLAQIWALCDTNQSGKLTMEQFALAMWMVEQKQKGIDPPEQLTPMMIPPSQRNVNKKLIETVPLKPSRESYANPELELIAIEIEKLTSERTKLEHEIAQKEADLRIKNGEVKSLQSELDTLTATLKQLEAQKVEAEKRLNDLKLQVTKIRIQCQKQEEIIKEKEGEVNSRRDELQKLKDQETTLEKEYQKNQNDYENCAKQLQTIQLQISQVKFMVTRLEEIKSQMISAISTCKSAINSNDLTAVPDYSLSIQPDFRDTKNEYEKKILKVDDPFNDRINQDKLKTATATDKFADAFGTSDPFTSNNFSGDEDPFDDSGNSHINNSNQNKDDFGCDPFAILHAPTADNLHVNKSNSGPPPRPESPSPALPPKKAKQPPPRPAPPRPLTGPTVDSDGTNTSSSSFADFSNFESKVHQINDFSDDPFKDYRYEDPFNIEDPFEKDAK